MKAANPGGCGAFRFGAGVAPFAKGQGVLHAGETVEIITPGAGGHGAPCARDPAALARDLADQRIDPATAAAVYPQLRRSITTA